LITVISFALSVVMSYISNEALASAGTILSFAVLLLFIALGIVFDMIGVASTSATEKEFHSMAAHRVRGAREAVWMVRNAEKVSSICNDVVGDICGIISGATGALIVAHITSGVSAGLKVVVSLLITGLVSALTIGGKAAGKGIAVMCSSKVLALCGRVLSVLPLKLDNRK
jgi:CBS domain containing-hemolysin-like protein